MYPYIIYVPAPDLQQLFLPAESPPTEPPDPVAEPSVHIEFNGFSAMFNSGDGVELDSYHDPSGAFIQRCIVCTSDTLPGFRAIYRPDEKSIREEWVFEYGDPWIDPPTASAPPYKVTITLRDGTTVIMEAPVGHFWYSRWRWQSTPRLVRRTYDQLAAQNLIPHFDTTGLVFGNIATVSNYTPMAYCGLPPGQTQTGAYPGLGIQTGWQTQYLTRGAPESSFRNQAEASGTYQAHVRDTRTHAPINLIDDYPKATMYAASTGTPFIPRGPGENITDQGHMPSVSYVPFLLTGDPYYLEEMQFWANQNMLAMPGNSSRFMVSGRYLAWPLRALYECYIATPDTVPTWFLTKSYWLSWVDKCRGFVETRMANNSDPFYYVFHTIPDTGQVTDRDPNKTGDHVWQQAMLHLVAAWIACTRSEWIEPAEWLIHNSIGRSGKNAGWCRSRPAPYHIRLQHASVLREAMNTTTDVMRIQYRQDFQPGDTVRIDSEVFVLKTVSPDGLDWTFEKRTKPANHATKAAVYGDKCLSWAEAAQVNVLTYGWDDTADNDHFSSKTTDITYHSYMRAALAQAIHAGLDVPGLVEAYEYMDSEMRRLVASKKLFVGDNWCVVPAVGAVQRRYAHRSDESDPQHNWEMSALLDEVRTEDEDPDA